ncbi:MAG: GreA/GreB family elongation factor [Microscillaceae bacterium]|nr:GreA/GreB family elongation factor [Microscillaceae bacterium]
MENLLAIKKALYQLCVKSVEEKIEITREAIKSADEAAIHEDKNSMADKYETGKAMLDLEKEKLETQLASTVMLKKHLSKINPSEEEETTAFGSLVITNQGRYFFSVGLGTLKYENQDYFVISLISPIGKALEGKKVGETVVFQNKKFTIEGIA